MRCMCVRFNIIFLIAGKYTERVEQIQMVIPVEVEVEKEVGGKVEEIVEKVVERKA